MFSKTVYLSLRRLYCIPQHPHATHRLPGRISFLTHVKEQCPELCIGMLSITKPWLSNELYSKLSRLLNPRCCLIPSSILCQTKYMRQCCV